MKGERTVGYQKLLKNLKDLENCTEEEAVQIIDNVISALKLTLVDIEINKIFFKEFGSFYFHKTTGRSRTIPSGQLVISESREILKFKAIPRILESINNLRKNNKKKRREKL